MAGLHRLIDQAVHLIQWLTIIVVKFPIVPATCGLLCAVRWGRRRVRSGGNRRDPWTLIGLSTWRPAWRYRAVTVPGVVVVVLLYLRDDLAAVALVGGLAAFWALGWLDELIAEETARARALGVADRFLLACVESKVQGTNRWLRTPYPTPVAARPVGDNVELTVHIPPAMDVERLSTFDEMLGASLDAQALRIIPHVDRPLSHATVEVLFRPLRPGFPMTNVCPSPTEELICVGQGFNGPVWWKPDLQPGLGVFGGTGSGKGRTARWIALQWLDPRYNRRLVLIDPQGSGEWSSLARHPWVTYLPYRVTDAGGSLTAIRDALLAVLADVEARNALAGVHDVDRWADLPDDVKGEHPRTLILTDEASALLAVVERDDPTRPLRQEIGTLLATIYRTVRKGGYSPCHVDQFTYSGGSYLGEGAIGQLGRWIALGGIRPEHRQMIAGFQDWPYYTPVPGLGLTGVRADTNPEPVEQPDVDRALTDRTLTAWGVPTGPVTRQEESEALPEDTTAAGAPFEVGSPLDRPPLPAPSSRSLPVPPIVSSRGG